jgi:cytochrome d ubiquinol oxidase subunit II
MAETWFVIIALMFTVFAVLEGWNFGAGTLHRVVARTPAERSQVVAAIGSLWIWNETWLVGIGGVMLMAFPAEMAASFSGFYMAFSVMLWCLLVRGVALEFGGHLEDGLWRAFWDMLFARASLLLALLFGVALGNLMRGVPLEADGTFSMALFTDFSPLGHVGILDWYTVSVGLATVLLVMAHGASYLAWRTVGQVHQRSRAVARWAWPLSGLLLALVTVLTWSLRPELFARGAQRPLEWICLALIAAGILALVLGYRRKRAALHFLGSVLVLLGLLAGAFGVLYPDILHSTLGEATSLPAQDRPLDQLGLTMALIWWPVALVAVVATVLVVLRTPTLRPPPPDAIVSGPPSPRDQPQP